MPDPEQDRPSKAEIDAHYADRLHQAWSDAKDVFEIGARVVVTHGYYTDTLGTVIGAGVELDGAGVPTARIWVLFDKSSIEHPYSINDLDHLP